jgi:hypothetical protein
VPVAAEDDQAFLVVGAQPAERVDAPGVERLRRERHRIAGRVLGARELGRLSRAGERARTRVDDQALALGDVRDVRVAQRVLRRVAGLARADEEPVPDRLLVGEVDRPLDPRDAAGAGPHRLAGTFPVVAVDLEAGALAPHQAGIVAEVLRAEGAPVRVDRQPAGGLRRDVEVLAVADARDPDRGVDLVGDGAHVTAASCAPIGRSWSSVACSACAHACR